jgi:hypothetical protein
MISTLDRDRDSSSNRNIELDDDENDDTPPHWMRSHGTLFPRDSLERTNRGDVLKFQSKDHRYSSNYFGIDEYSGDFNNEELCPGSELRYKRYFNSSVKNVRDQDNSSLSSSSTGAGAGAGVGSKASGENQVTHEAAKTTRYRESEVIVLTPGSRRQILIKVACTPGSLSDKFMINLLLTVVDSNNSCQ